MEEFVSKQLDLAFKVEIPIMKKLTHLSHEQLIEISTISMTEYLGYLSENKAKEQIETSLERWVSDQLEIIGKFELQADDITLINFVRAKSFRAFIPSYTKDLTIILELADELDSFFTTSTTTATNTYIDIL
jgi:hypothetical protein